MIHYWSEYDVSDVNVGVVFYGESSENVSIVDVVSGGECV